ncbi:hypothetical protein XMM379_003032 [Aliiroseovarius sp. xm-m-379]|nr:hypothetical protein [Aliiroseovarius sp. xm-d-517]NRP26317.1 hypothetical protein [Aliiroseovarius sp. xm-m-379]NRP32085.1 hypothetical protein [Aliiroseovarius sp. xm-m-314]NRP35116.1 hypothetical protein [Aliiroseovarius sp. xm-a-104]NRP42677.1 hypothetical protein [Aliiroseovarius sp. xm-m-339-2]NRP45864.1 hypothetical protein [Aliiroseovarius sp. xm-m-378]NRP51385.1 hypothetical protein [Aliiroseovarius sp. xm-m-354]NRP63589.1 hypothetical protein [Aliiroseovarius sp. xm-a-151]NRP66
MTASKIATMREQYHKRGWLCFPHDKAVQAWVRSAQPFARRACEDPHQISHWLRCGKTWFVGVNALPNNGEGRLADGGPLQGALRAFVTAEHGWYPLDRGQVSITYPGYPKRDEGETEAAHRFRRNRASAHIDGVKPELADGQRCVDEAHAYVIGIPLNNCGAGASPLVVWDGSHLIMRAAFETALQGVPPERMRRHDITEIYRDARARVFETCRKVEVQAGVGESYLLHRFTLHGVAPWQEGAKAPQEGRMIAYFRPEFPGGIADWLTLP